MGAAYPKIRNITSTGVTRRRTTFTREGICWLLASVGLWLTGWLKGINLILLLAYLLLLLLGLNWIAARRALRRWLMHSARPDERAGRSRRRLALEAEFHGLRQFRAGDSPRWIHWRTSARTGELVVREFDHGTHNDLVLILEPFADQDDHEAV